MPYPPAPWSLKGFALQSLRLVDSARAQAFVPPPLQIVSVLPGKTLGVLYVASYGPESVLSYNELIVAPALTCYRKHIGFWISHIYVDHPDSIAGGREIWGLPKQLAQFTWQLGEPGQVTVRQNEQLLCALHSTSQRRLWRQWLFVPALSMLDTKLLWFKGAITAQVGFGKGRVDVPSTSPFAALGFTRARHVWHFNTMRFVAHAPKVVHSAIAHRQM
jgi:acetoacetate decarboxylase